jgi:hypothetical protein
MNINMMRVVSILKNVLPPRKPTLPLLGRWKIEKCDTKINIKIKLANEDHCGVCDHYVIPKQVKYLYE